MSDIIFMLRLEHGNTARLLGLFEDQLHRLESGAPLDADLLRLAQEYLSGYLQKCHHPKEDLLFNLLRRRDPPAAAVLADLVAEHQLLAQRTEALGPELRDAFGRGKGTDGTFAVSLREFIELQRRHMVREERDFFPVALRLLAPDDFAELDYRLFDERDHLFDDQSETHFERLRGEINALAAEPARQHGYGALRSAYDEISLLRQLTNVGQLNRTLVALGFRLLACRSGGYSLERDGHWLIDIPECDENRAVWSAYYFVKGLTQARVPDP
jgi:hemerythrin-like domain-containing protein